MVFLELQATFGVSLELCWGAQGASHVAPGKSSLHSTCEGERGIVLESWQGNRASRCGEGGISRSISRWEGNPGFPGLVTVTSGSFSWCLWEVRYTVEFGGASWDSTGFGAMEEGLISSSGGNLSVPLLL